MLRLYKIDTFNLFKGIKSIMMALFNEDTIQKAYGQEKIEEGWLLALIDLVKDGLLTIADASKKAHMTEADFTAILAANT